METDISRRGFLALGALGLGSVALGQNVAFADSLSTKGAAREVDSLIPSGGVALNYIDPACPEARIVVVDPNDDLPQTIDPKRVDIKRFSDSFSEESNEGETEYEISISGLCSEQELVQSSGAISTQSANSAKVNDTVVSAKVTATWVLSGDNKKINLKKVTGTIKPKMGSISKKGYLIKNEDREKQCLNFKGNSFSYSPKWGFREFHTAQKESLHFVNVWFTAKASGMGGKKEIVIFFTYGTY